jgi:hypothetical protein
MNGMWGILFYYTVVWVTISMLLFASGMIAARIIRHELERGTLLVIVMVSTLFLLIPCIGFLLFPFALLYLLVNVGGLNLWPPALVVALISTISSVLVFQLLEFICKKLFV